MSQCRKDFRKIVFVFDLLIPRKRGNGPSESEVTSVTTEIDGPEHRSKGKIRRKNCNETDSQ